MLSLRFYKKLITKEKPCKGLILQDTNFPIHRPVESTWYCHRVPSHAYVARMHRSQGLGTYLLTTHIADHQSERYPDEFWLT